MKHFREELWFNTKTRRAYINITDKVQAAIDKSGIKEGLCLVNAMHISASVYINDDESVNKSSTANSTGAATSVFWSRLLGSDPIIK